MATTLTDSRAAKIPNLSDVQESDFQSQSRRRPIGFARLMLLLVIVGGVGTCGWYVLSVIKPNGSTVAASLYTVERRSFPVIEEVKGELKAANTTELRSKVEGRTTLTWIIDEGVTVKKGDLLVRLASDQIEERITKEEATEASAKANLEAAVKDLEILLDQNESDILKAELALEVAQTERKKYIEGDAKKNLMDAELELERAIQKHKRAKLDYDAALKLHEQGYITTSDFLGDEFELHESERAIEKAKLSLTILNIYAHPQELRKKDADIEEASKELARVKKSALAKAAQKRADVEAKRANLLNTQNQLKKYREQLDFTEIHAPTPGLVIYNTGNRWNQREIEVGAEIHEQQSIVTLPDPSVMVVSVRIHEAKTSKIKLGQKARIEVEGIPGTTFTGEITKIAPVADSSNRWLNPDLKEYETEITLDQSNADLKPGVTARTEIIVAEASDVLAVPPQSVYTKSGRNYVFKPSGGQLEPQEVQLGLSSNDLVEIANGVSAGERVALAVPEDVMHRLPSMDIVQQNAAAAARPGQAPGAKELKGRESKGRRGNRSSQQPRRNSS